ncbi:MAG: hypothetical protein P8Y27_11535 [Chromatiaceae bacterium]|jgi:signal transduction protein with GAF and PtsI domain
MRRRAIKSVERLNELGRIVRDVDTAADLESALRVIVQRTRSVMKTDVCTVYHETRHRPA